MASADSVSGEPSFGVFTADRVTTVLPRHEVVKLDEGTYLQWRKQVKLIVNGYGLTGFLDGTVASPSRFVILPDGSRALNSAAPVFTQQDQLLMSWLLSTVTSSYQSSFDYACTACDIWIARIKDLCAMLDVSGSRIFDEEKIEVVLAGLPSDFEAVISSARLSSGVLPLQHLVDVLVDCESRQDRVLQDVSLNANLVEDAPSVEGVSRGGRTSVRGHGRTFRSRIQCQICNSNDSSVMPSVSHQGAPSGVERANFRLCAQEEEEQWNYVSQNRNGGQNWSNGMQSQNRNGGQNWSASMQSEKLARGPQVSYANDYGRPYGNTFQPNLRQFGNDDGPGFNSNGFNRNAPLDFVDGNGRRVLQWPHVANSSHGSNVEPNANGVPSSNFVQVYQSDPGSLELIGVDRGLRFTKPRAQVYTRFDPCIGFPQLGDLHASDYSGSSVFGSHVNTAQLRSGTGNDDPYIPMRGGTISWYPDLGASHHVCRDVSALCDVTPFSGTSSLLMGDGTPAVIS
ncbi:hypothetical protein V6Z12_D10G110700 [Gossypium hirsutum]